MKYLTLRSVKVKSILAKPSKMKVESETATLKREIKEAKEERIKCEKELKEILRELKNEESLENNIVSMGFSVRNS